MLRRRIGLARGYQLIFTGRPVAADEAVALGIADRRCDDLSPEARLRRRDRGELADRPRPRQVEAEPAHRRPSMTTIMPMLLSALTAKATKAPAEATIAPPIAGPVLRARLKPTLFAAIASGSFSRGMDSPT